VDVEARQADALPPALCLKTGFTSVTVKAVLSAKRIAGDVREPIRWVVSKV